MSTVVSIAWTVFGITTVILSLFSLGFIKYFQSKQNQEILATAVSVMSNIIVLATAALLPIDIFLVSSTIDHQTGLKKLWADTNTIYWMTFSVKMVYYVLYGLILIFSFFIIPFSFFYYEKEGQTKNERRTSALKYTTFFTAIAAILFLFGLFIKPQILPPHIDLDWFRYLLVESYGSKTIWFVIGCLFVPGLCIFIFYTAPGLSMIPFQLIKGKRKIDIEKDEISQRLTIVREQQKLLEDKYSGSDNTLNTNDYRTLENLNDEERILVRRLNCIEESYKSSLLQKMLILTRPIKLFAGLVLLLFNILMCISIIMTMIDKLSFSVCGRKCGYIISQSKLFNPLNNILLRLQRLFPMDYILMISIIIYFFLATMTGIVNIGIRLLWATLYRIKKSATSPHGLLFCSILLSFSILAFNYSMTSVIAPGYAHYGTQVYCNHTEGGRRDCTNNLDKIFYCDIYAPIEICTPTISSTLIDRITLNTPLFGLIFYYSQWIFLLSFLLGFMICLFKSSYFRQDESCIHHVEDEEERRSLLEEDDNNRRHINSYT